MSSTELRITSLSAAMHPTIALLSLEPSGKRGEYKKTFEFSFIPRVDPPAKIESLDASRYRVSGGAPKALLEQFRKHLFATLSATFQTLNGFRTSITKPTSYDFERFFTITIEHAPLGLEIHINRKVK